MSRLSRAPRTAEAEPYQELAAEVSPCGWVGRKNLHIVARRGKGGSGGAGESKA